MTRAAWAEIHLGTRAKVKVAAIFREIMERRSSELKVSDSGPAGLRLPVVD